MSAFTAETGKASCKETSIQINTILLQPAARQAKLSRMLVACKFCFAILLGSIGLSACGEGPARKTGAEHDSTGKVTSVADLVPQDRSTVSKEPVATFSEKVKNPLNDWRFQVQLFETPKTFRYLMKLEFEEMRESDTLKIPNLGFEPKLKIIKGNEPNSCIIGFMDKKDKFREYKKVIASNNRLRVITLKHYAVYTK